MAALMDFVTVLVPLALGLYGCLLLALTKRGTQVVPPLVRMRILFIKLVVSLFRPNAAFARLAASFREVQKIMGSEHVRGLAADVSSPLKVQKITKERVSLNAEMLFGDRRWVRDKNGRLVERYGSPQDGDEDMIRTLP